MNKINKNFSAVEMKRKIQAEIYEEIKHLTPEQELEYYHKKGQEGPFGKFLKTTRDKQKKKSAASE